MKKGVIYDLDGTIISTTVLHHQAWQEAGKLHRIPITDNFLKEQSGRPNEEAAKILLEENYNQIGESFVQAKSDFVSKNTHLAAIFDGFLETQQELGKRNISAWIATAGSKEFINSIFETLPDLKIFAGKTVYREMYTRGKPDPEPILLTAKLMNLSIAECVYVGDAYNDFLASKSAGCEFIYFCKNLDEKDPRIPREVLLISNHLELLGLI